MNRREFAKLTRAVGNGEAGLRPAGAVAGEGRP
jgi:hypothetical protein